AVANYNSNTVSVLLGQANAATHFLLTTPPSVTAGTPFPLTVRALDAQGNTAVRFTGTVFLTSSDGTFAPTVYTFVPTDFGVHTSSGPLNEPAPHPLPPDPPGGGVQGSVAAPVYANGLFAPAVSLPGGAKPAAVALADLNGDGKADLGVANQ